MHIKKCRSVRASLRHHPLVTAELNKFWTAVESLLPSDNYVDGNSVLTFEEYRQVQLRLSRALASRGARALTEKEATRAAKRDWELDRDQDQDSAFQFMKRKTFLDAMFKVADVWAPGTTPVEYAAFLIALHAAVCDPANGLLRVEVEKVQPISGVDEEDMMHAMREQARRDHLPPRSHAVSYTHLTLPTILLV